MIKMNQPSSDIKSSIAQSIFLTNRKCKMWWR